MTSSVQPREGEPLSPPGGREGIRPPKFAGKFSLLDFGAEPMPVISMFEPPAPEAIAATITIRGDDLRDRALSSLELRSLPVQTLAAPLVCQIFNWYEQVEWAGVRLVDVFAAFGPETHPEGYYAFRSLDGQYFETLSRDGALDPRVLIAFG